eukprot:TRINITY_DN10059_c0_g1_i2.p1 TRINITY_DN10059_c0_g1~~TRINITY_DN10059_c0_g1_i2.p1  ORF type:complete len:519 (-),score=71.72 TRINITY_DN10059_c0_g1_i2:99-1655(-)
MSVPPRTVIVNGPARPSPRIVQAKTMPLAPMVRSGYASTGVLPATATASVVGLTVTSARVPARARSVSEAVIASARSVDDRVVTTSSYGNFGSYGQVMGSAPPPRTAPAVCTVPNLLPLSSMMISGSSGIISPTSPKAMSPPQSPIFTSQGSPSFGATIRPKASAPRQSLSPVRTTVPSAQTSLRSIFHFPTQVPAPKSTSSVPVPKSSMSVVSKSPQLAPATNPLPSVSKSPVPAPATTSAQSVSTSMAPASTTSALSSPRSSTSGMSPSASLTRVGTAPPLRSSVGGQSTPASKDTPTIYETTRAHTVTMSSGSFPTSRMSKLQGENTDTQPLSTYEKALTAAQIRMKADAAVAAEKAGMYEQRLKEIDARRKKDLEAAAQKKELDEAAGRSSADKAAAGAITAEMQRHKELKPFTITKKANASEAISLSGDKWEVPITTAHTVPAKGEVKKDISSTQDVALQGDMQKSGASWTSPFERLWFTVCIGRPKDEEQTQASNVKRPDMKLQQGRPMKTS